MLVLLTNLKKLILFEIVLLPVQNDKTVIKKKKKKRKKFGISCGLVEFIVRFDLDTILFDPIMV